MEEIKIDNLENLTDEKLSIKKDENVFQDDKKILPTSLEQNNKENLDLNKVLSNLNFEQMSDDIFGNINEMKEHVQLQQQQQQQSQGDVTATANSPQKVFGSNRMSRSIRGWKKPLPQPHICVLDKTIDEQDVFINVLSWSKISKPKDPKDPIPLFGGNRVFSSNALYKELFIYAVTAHPAVLEKTRRCDGYTEEQYALMMLMTDFVGAMNPGLQLKKQPVLLLDRDLTGELKEIWQAIQLRREKEKFSSIEKSGNVFYEEFGPPTPEGSDDPNIELQNSAMQQQSQNLAPSPNEINSEILSPNSSQDTKTIDEKEKMDLDLDVSKIKLNADPCDKEILNNQTNDTTADSKPNEKDNNLNTIKSLNNESIQISPTTEKTQQIESFKKRLEILTNGCQNFFLFKSKNSQNCGNSVKKKEKSSGGNSGDEKEKSQKDIKEKLNSPKNSKNNNKLKMVVDDCNLKNNEKLIVENNLPIDKTTTLQHGLGKTTTNDDEILKK